MAAFHSMLLARLTERVSAWTPNQRIGDVFVDLADIFKVYSPYCINLPAAKAKVEELSRDATIKALLKKCEVTQRPT